MPYRAKDLLHLSGVSLNSGAIAATSCDALLLVAYVGDADGNGAYSSNDAVLITGVALQTDTGFAAYPLVDPVIVADTDGSGFIPADAALQVNEAGVGFATNNLPSPPIPPGVMFQAIANNVDPTLSLGVKGLGSGVSVAVNIDDAHPAGSTGLIEAHLALTYNPSLFTVSAADVHLGSLLQRGGWSVTPTIDPTSGQIAIALSSSTPITSALGGSLVTIDFHQIVGRTASPSAINLVASVNINGQVTAAELEDAQGTFILTPTPVNGFDPRLDGVVSMPATQVATGLNPGATVEVPARLVVFSQTNEIAPEAPAVETAGTLAATSPATGEEEVTASAAAEPVHATVFSVHAGTAIVSAATSLVALLGAVPLPGTVSQIISTAVSSVPGGSLAAGQHLTDQFFQALARGTATDATTPLLLAPTPDSSNAISGDEVSPSWDASLPTLRGLLNRARRVLPPAETPLQKPSPDQAALDQVFAQAADETVAVVSDE
jgi:hypothetical protein